MRKKTYDMYVCLICKDGKPHLAVLDSHSKNYTWCNTCQKDTPGKWIKVIEK